MILRKLLAKLFAQVGCAYLPPTITAWRYQRGRTLVVDNLCGGGAIVSGATTNDEGPAEADRDNGGIVRATSQKETTSSRSRIRWRTPRSISSGP